MYSSIQLVIIQILVSGMIHYSG